MITHLPTVLVTVATSAMVVFATIALATGRLRWRVTAGVIAGAVLVGGVAIDRALERGAASAIGITAGFLGLIALAFHFALRELGALDPAPPTEPGPDVLAVDLSDRDR